MGQVFTAVTELALNTLTLAIATATRAADMSRLPEPALLLLAGIAMFVAAHATRKQRERPHSHT